eukprot:TRINITY_DN85019_c0_g1_i1.p1 TRINITY_DN85019_c0_g1~~TRINITY_DN85019_c0_g1_i1.p1  ORF type:complete len:200 (+),score=30.89 TRINITY_DN85019_c0_g1_i1:70-669(+)
MAAIFRGRAAIAQVVQRSCRPALCLRSARGFAEDGRQKSSDEGAKSSGSSSSGTGGSESDRRYEETGEYDTQDKYKRVGNPISWANPTGGPGVEDTTSKHWRWIYPAGAGLIVVLCLISRWRNMRKEKEEEVMQAPQISVPDTRRFSYQPPSSEPIAPEDLAPAPGGGASSLPSDTLSPSYGGGSSSSFSSPPSSSSRW